MAASLSYDGTGDYVTIGDNLDFERTDTFSLECWIKTNSTTDMGAICKMQSSGDIKGYILHVRGADSPQKWSFQFINTVSPLNDIWVTEATDVLDNTWHHIAATYDGSSLASGVQLYIDGKLGTMTTQRDNIGTGTTITAIPFNIGARNDGADQIFNGNIDEVRVWNDVRTAAEIKAFMFSELAGNEQGLVGYWRLDEGSGTTTRDRGPSNFTTNITGAAWSSDIAPIGVGGGLSLMGTG